MPCDFWSPVSIGAEICAYRSLVTIGLWCQRDLRVYLSLCFLWTVLQAMTVGDLMHGILIPVDSSEKRTMFFSAIVFSRVFVAVDGGSTRRN